VSDRMPYTFVCRMSYYKWSETGRCFVVIAFELCCRILHEEGPRKQSGFGIELDTSASSLC
jgi:hypothetical protein